MNAKHDGILTVDELAAYLKFSKSTLYKLAVEGKLPGQKVGKRWRFHQDAIDEWVKSGTGTVASHKSGGNTPGDRA
jgi:excisionase family DNA binding protein